MKTILILLFALGFLSACKKTNTENVVPEPELTKFFKSESTVSYERNAQVNIRANILKLKKNTYVSVDWGDGNKDSANLILGEIDPAISYVSFSHKYQKNDNYKVLLKAVNSSMTDTLSVPITITNKEVPPVADFSYEILEGGRVKFKNLSKGNIATYYWSDSKVGYWTYEQEPQFIYELNDTYSVSLTVNDSLGQYSTIVKQIPIINANGRQLASFKGTIFGKDYDWIENNVDCRAFLREIDPGRTALINYFTKSVSPDEHWQISVVGTFYVMSAMYFDPVKRYTKFKENLTVGVKSVGNQGTNQWNAGIYLQTQANDGFRYRFFNDDPNASIEITEVKEVDQPGLFKDVYNKAFWVTFKLKAEFKDLGKIEGTLKTRYMVYRIM
ncbi:PKD domain-containing protein [Emticicia soli]|uniref:PKD domain-containing protein n=1 Tax=Emticicia soli TaxID=2027878 RepID=A0ABW5J945_9BACT